MIRTFSRNLVIVSSLVLAGAAFAQQAQSPMIPVGTTPIFPVYAVVGQTVPVSGATLTIGMPSGNTYSFIAIDPSANQTALLQGNAGYGRLDLMSYSSEGNTQGPVVSLDYVHATPAANDVLGHYAFRGNDDQNTNQDTYAYIHGIALTVTHASLNSQIQIGVMQNVNATSGGNQQPNLFLTFDATSGLNTSGQPLSAGTANITQIYARGTAIPAPQGSCGTGPTSAGTQLSGWFVVGTGGGTNCVLTPLPITQTHKPVCFVTDYTHPTTPVSYIGTTTSYQFQGVFAAGDEIDFICADHQ